MDTPKGAQFRRWLVDIGPDPIKIILAWKRYACGRDFPQKVAGRSRKMAGRSRKVAGRSRKVHRAAASYRAPGPHRPIAWRVVSPRHSKNLDPQCRPSERSKNPRQPDLLTADFHPRAHTKGMDCTARRQPSTCAMGYVHMDAPSRKCRAVTMAVVIICHVLCVSLPSCSNGQRKPCKAVSTSNVP